MKHPIAIMTGCLAILVGGSSIPTTANGLPERLVPSIYGGSDVNKTTGGDVCLVGYKDECQMGKPSGSSGGYRYPGSVAVDPRTGDVYVADSVNNRVQRLTATGVFISMFGWNVNGAKDKSINATRAERNFCRAGSTDCTVGAKGTAAGQFAYPASIAVDPASGDIYVLEADVHDFRVDKYTASGRFVWRMGRSVNGRTKGDICTAREVDTADTRCGAGAEGSSDDPDPYAFKFAQHSGDLLVVGGPDGLLYVGDEHRVEEFEADGRWRREILLASISAERESDVTALAVDDEGNVYVVYRTMTLASGARVERADAIHKFTPDGEQSAEFILPSRLAGAVPNIIAMANDLSGRLAVIGVENSPSSFRRFGSVYDARTGNVVSDFMPPRDNDGIAFDEHGDLYVAATDDQEFAAYVPVPAVELFTNLTPCQIVDASREYAAFNCAMEAA